MDEDLWGMPELSPVLQRPPRAGGLNHHGLSSLGPHRVASRAQLHRKNRAWSPASGGLTLDPYSKWSLIILSPRRTDVLPCWNSKVRLTLLSSPPYPSNNVTHFGCGSGASARLGNDKMGVFPYSLGCFLKTWCQSW